MKRSIHDIRDNLDYVGCDDDTARELCDEVQRLRIGIGRLAMFLLDGCRIARQSGEWCVFDADGECNDNWFAGSLIELVEKLGERESH